MERNVGNACLDDAQRKLVEENINLVYDQAHKRGILDEDLIQEGMLGLVNAARFYSSEYGVKFSTYAASYIWAALFGSYSDKKYRKNQAFTCSLDDEDLNIQPSMAFDDETTLLTVGVKDPLARDIVQKIFDGFSKCEIRELFNISESKLNSILDKVGREIYGERYNKEAN